MRILSIEDRRERFDVECLSQSKFVGSATPSHLHEMSHAIGVGVERRSSCCLEVSPRALVTIWREFSGAR
jgi:hypothetical protein